MILLSQNEHIALQIEADRFKQRVYDITRVACGVTVEFVTEEDGSITQDDFIRKIKQLSCEAFGVKDISLISQKTRKREVCDARFTAISIISNQTNLSLSKIGIEFGGRNHSTIIAAKEVVSDMLETNPPFRKKYNSVNDIATKLKVKYFVDRLTIKY